MPTVHFLNVGDGDCSILQHGSDRVTMIDICSGNLVEEQEEAVAGMEVFENKAGAGGNYGMKNRPTNPVDYCKRHRIGRLWRFVLTHPDMDHMDGLNNLASSIGFNNFWETGVRREKPDFSEGRYDEDDWDCYAKLAARKYDGVTVLSNLAGAEFQFANKGEPNDCGDYLSIVAPDKELVAAGTETEECNDASYALVYRTCGGNIIFPGDAHDATWKYVTTNHRDLVENCGVLIAPHHGRKSDRDYSFLDVVKPGLTLFGCAPSEHLAYSAWSSRDLLYITNNQAGNIILDGTKAGIEVFIENLEFAKTWKHFNEQRTMFGCYYIGLVAKPVKQEQPA